MNVKKLYKNELSKSESSWKRIDTNRTKLSICFMVEIHFT